MNDTLTTIASIPFAVADSEITNWLAWAKSYYGL